MREIGFTAQYTLAGLVGALMAWPLAAQAQERQLFMAVTDPAGQPVAGLTAAEVQLDMEGAECSVTRMEPETDKLKIALMIDASGSAADSIVSLRAGLKEFLDVLPPQHEVGLFTITSQTRRRVDFTTDRDELREQAEKLFGEGSPGVALIDGLRETWDRRFEDEDPWPVFVVVVYDGAERSNGTDNEEFSQFATDLMFRGATYHAIAVTASGGSLQAQVSRSLTQNTGGTFNPIATAVGLPRALTELATTIAEHHDQVKDRYRVFYECDPEDAAGGISVGVTAASGQRLQMGLFADRRVEP